MLKIEDVKSRKFQPQLFMKIKKGIKEQFIIVLLKMNDGKLVTQYLYGLLKKLIWVALWILVRSV